MAEECNPPAVTVQGIAHIGLLVRDAAVSAQFYRRVLGARPLNRPAFKGAGYWLLLGSGPQAMQLHLIQADADDSGPSSSTPGGAIAMNTGDHFALQVADFDAAERALLAHGVEYSRAYIPAGLAEAKMPRQLFFADPDGHALELCECSALDRFATGPRPSLEAALEAARSYIEGVPVQPAALLVLVVALFSWKALAATAPGSLLSDALPAAFFMRAADEAFGFLAAQSRDATGAAPTTIQARSLTKTLAKLASQTPLYSQPLSSSFQVEPHDDNSESTPLSSSAVEEASWAGLLATPFRQDRLCAEIARYSPSACELDQAAFAAMIVDELESKSLVGDLRSVFCLVASARQPSGQHTVLFPDYYLALTKLGIYLSDAELRGSYSQLADPASPDGVPFETFLRLLPCVSSDHTELP